MHDPRISAIRAAIDADEAGVEAEINAPGAPSGRLGPLRDTHAAHRRLLTLAEEYSPELDSGDNGEWALAEVLDVLADLYDVRTPPGIHGEPSDGE